MLCTWTQPVILVALICVFASRMPTIELNSELQKQACNMESLRAHGSYSSDCFQTLSDATGFNK